MAENILTNLDNQAYHSNRSHLSSSTLKLILKDIRRFKAEWIDGQKLDDVPKNAFDEGTFTHALILEPHKIETDFAVYPGLRKAGNEFEKFKAENPSKLILSAAQVHRCEKLYESCKNHKIAMKLLFGGIPEHSLVSTILDVPVKMRADYIVPGEYIVDVKTTALPTDSEVFRQTVSQYGYELSASLYAQIAYDNFKKLHDFYWVVLSKADGGCAVYKASTETLTIGAGLVTQALVKYKNCLATNNWTDDAKSSTITEEVEEI